MSGSADKSGHSSNETDLSGRELAGFQVLRRLGRGAMADVYLAEQTALKRRVALKVLKPELASDTTYLKRFEREARRAYPHMRTKVVTNVAEAGYRVLLGVEVPYYGPRRVEIRFTPSAPTVTAATRNSP